MTRAPVLVLFVCEVCGHELATLPAASVWCTRTASHPPRSGPVAMTPKNEIHPEKETHR